MTTPLSALPPGKFQVSLPAIKSINAVGIVGLGLLACAGYVGTLMANGTADAANVQNQLQLLALAVFGAAGVGGWATSASGGKSTSGAPAPQRAALASLAAYCLADPVAMDLIQRLASRVSAQASGETQSSSVRSVPDIMRELETRLRHDMVQTVLNGVPSQGQRGDA